MKPLFSALILIFLATGCETPDATQAVFVNRYPAGEVGAPNTVVLSAGWWSVAELDAAVLPGAESDPVRIVKGTDYAYALLAIGWDPESGALPTRVIPVRSRAQLSAARGDTLRIEISDATTLGNCASGEPLSQADADFITQRIFPGPFSGLTYDAATCTTSAVSDAGDGQGEGGEGGGAG